MVIRPDRDGDQQLRLLDDAWDKASQYWLDGMARQFESGHWTPLVRESRGYLEALRKLMDVLEAAERDTDGEQALPGAGFTGGRLYRGPAG